MAQTYISLLRHLERVHEPLWKIMREQKIIQTKWIKHLRWGFNMSARQLGKRMEISQQTARDIERREIEGNITLESLRKAANAFDMDLFYMFVPRKDIPVERALEAIQEKQAMKLAKKLVSRSSQTMKLEDQATGQKAIDENIQEMAAELIRKQHGSIWE